MGYDAFRAGPEPEIPQRVHLVGIGGMHMSAIAQILLQRGHTVSGSDRRASAVTRRLAELGAQVYENHDAAHLGDTELLVATFAAPEDNPEVAEARRRGLPVLHRAEMVARLLENHIAAAVAGTHGKTTTTSLLAYILERAGLAPMYLLGGESIDLGGNASAGRSEVAVVEADEYGRAFLEYRPHLALVTNIQADHLDYFANFEEIKGAYRQFLSRVQPEGRIIACADDQAVMEVLSRPDANPLIGAGLTETYAIGRLADWRAVEVRPQGDGHAFRVLYRNRDAGEFRTRLPGLHNVSNCLGAIGAAAALDVPFETIQEAVADFRGVHRRFERVGRAAGVLVMDDYAHHPTEVRATIVAARQRFPGRRLLACFQPHTYSRTKYLLRDFKSCFAGLGALLVLETFAAREEPTAGMSARALAAAIDQPRARYVPEFQQATEAALAELRPGDVFFTIGAGDVDALGPMVLTALRRRQRSRRTNGSTNGRPGIGDAARSRGRARS